jgi:lipopolysaccharide export system protein LptA
MIPWRYRMLAAAGVAALCSPGALHAQAEPRHCRLVLEPGARTGYAIGQNNYFAAGNVRLRCDGTSVRIRSDSLASYASQIVEFIGNVRYEDSSMVMTADRGTYRRDGERWEARGNVVTRNTGGSTMRGPSLDYLRVVPGLRDTVEVYASGRPTIDYVPRDSTGAEQEKYVIVGDRVRMKGEDRLWAGGRVTIDRSDVAARADSMRLDTGPGQDGALIGRAQVDGLGKDAFSLTGNIINLRLEQNDLTYVQANGAGKAVSADWTLVADTIGLDVNARVLEQTLAWGSTVRPHAVSTTYEITADSLALDTPAKVLTEARAFGKAWVASGDDTTSAQRDWLRGDTVTARFAKVDSAGKSKTVVSRVESWTDASSFYQVFDPARPGVPSLNYARGNRILVLMKGGAEGGVDRVEIQGKVDGVQLEPKPAVARDTAAATTPATAADSAPGAVRP